MTPKTRILIIALLALVALITMPVSAQTITMSNPGGLNTRDIIAYYPNGTMYGYYNSTSVITIDPNESYIFALKPVGSNPMEDPGNWLDTAFTFVESNIIAILIICFSIGLIARRL